MNDEEEAMAMQQQQELEERALREAHERDRRELKKMVGEMSKSSEQFHRVMNDAWRQR